MNSPVIDAMDPLGNALKRCAPETLAAARRFRDSRDFTELPVVIHGVIARFVDREHRDRLAGATADLRLIEDLGIDSLTMMEIVMLAEEALPLSISNEELRHLRTVGEVEQFIISKLRGEAPATGSGCNTWYLDDLPAGKDSAAATPPP